MLPIVLFPHPGNADFKFTDSMIWRFICIDFYLLLFYYSNTHILIPQLLTKRKWLLYITTIIALLFLYLYLQKIFEDIIRSEMPEHIRTKMRRHHRSFLFPFSGSSAVFFLVFTVSTCSRVIQEWLGIENKKQEIEKEKLATELSFLKSQINPHFLFNTLNNIYSLALMKSESTADAVLKLSSIMRYVLSETKNDIVELDKEILFINHYIELQKVRVTDKVTIDFIVQGETEGKYMAPLIFIPFVENAFKYGISAKDKSDLYFEVKVDNDNIFFTATNKVVFRENIAEDDNTGIGIQNTKRRLELLYPGKHQLSVTKENNQFIVHLILYKNEMHSN